MSRKVGARRASKVGAFGFTILAIILSLMTAWLLSRMMSDTKYASEPVRSVVVAAKRIDAAVPILEDALKVVKYPASSIPEGAFESIDQVLGGQPRVALTTILKGEPILKPRLASSESGTGMASLIPKNRRGVVVPVDGWLAEARLVYPGAYVDVMTTLRNQSERQTNTKMVLQRIRVLAVNGAVDAASMAAEDDGEGGKKNKSPGSKTVVTLLVTPEESEALALASREGKIDLILRNAGDDGIVETFGISASELLGEEDEEEDAAALAGQKPKPRGRSRRSRRRRRPPVNPSAGKPDSEPARNTGGTKTINLGGN